MRIEEGKFYRTRDGRKVGPAKISKWPAKDLQWSLGCEMLYSDEGVYGYNFDTSMDIISEWTESPIRTETVTVRRIEPGVYGRLSVAEDTAPYVSIALTSRDGTEVIERYRRSLNAPELRELARVALEIAEYLENA